MKRVVMFSGGAGSWGAAKRVTDQHGTDGLTLLFSDTLIEDEDLYRYLADAAAALSNRRPPAWIRAAAAKVPALETKRGGLDLRRRVLAPLAREVSAHVLHLEWIAEGRDPWQVFFDERYLGNTRIDPCSKILKRKLMRRWLEQNCDPADTVVYLGFDWSEVHRFERAKGYWKPWQVEAPLCEPPLMSKADVLAKLEEAGVKPPRLYAMGFEHNNCGGFCVKAGQAQFERLLRVMPDRYRYHEQREQELREHLGKDVSILRDRRGGTVRPLTLREFRERLDVQPTLFDADEWGACACMEGDE